MTQVMPTSIPSQSTKISKQNLKYSNRKLLRYDNVESEEEEEQAAIVKEEAQNMWRSMTRKMTMSWSKIDS